MFSRALRSFRRHGMYLGLGLFTLLLLTATTGVPNAQAYTHELTGDGLGLSQGNKGTQLTVSPFLKLRSLVYGNRTGYPTGCSGTIYLHQTEGTGVQTSSWRRQGYPRIDGYYTGAYESLVFDFSTAVSAASIKLWLNRIHHHYDIYGYVWVDLWVKPSSGSAVNISNVLSYFHDTGGDPDQYHSDPNHYTNGTLSGYFDFSEIPDLNGVGSIERIIVRAGKYAHFHVSGIEYQLHLDNDLDGYPADADCNDNNPDVNPGETETCNDVDDNCDGNVDEGCTTYYRDADGDGYGDSGDALTATSPPNGYVATGGDCDDTDDEIYPGATEQCNGVDDDCDTHTDEDCTLWYQDADGDNYGDPDDSSTYEHDGYTTQNSGDCDDNNANINPGATEFCNGTDDNCDGAVDEGCTLYFRDADEDGYGDPSDFQVATSPPAGYVTNSGDCNDSNASINPGATEVCNGKDDNCDLNIDEGCTFYYRDADGDSYGNPNDSVEDTSAPSGYVANDDDCDDTDDTAYPGAVELCDGTDNDCDGNTDEGCPVQYRDADGDGYGNPAGPTTTIPQSGYVGNTSDCDDTNGAVNPGATEICNGIDDNCDGTVDEGCATYYRDADGDTYGNPADSTTATSQPAGYVANGGDCNDSNASINPGATETCNGVDDNCDGTLDEGCVTYYRDADGDAYGDSGNTTTDTSQPAGYVANAGDCNDANANINPGATEICNGVDDNCDGTIDEGCATYYRDADGDTYGDAGDSVLDTNQPAGYVANAGDCDDTNGAINPGATEICNGVDDNCDGNVDEGCATYYRDADGDTYGNPADSTTATSQPAGYVANGGDCNDGNASVNPGATEACNGTDDNCDGNVDEGCVTYYQDADTDGFGNSAVSQVATSQPAGYVTASGDCNDGDNTVYPGASELCDGKDNDCDTQIDEGCTLLYWDGDSDGYGNPGGPTTTVPQSGYVANAGDCDDNNANIYPAATETCNSVDDNCDGTIDEGCATFYRDADGDTFGDPGDSTTATSQPSGYVANAGDCNDANASVNPGATEICNSVDDNCDGNIDEGCVPYYRDADGDTYGDPGNTTVAMGQPSGYVTNSGDCNDANASVNPGATEICNGVDDNCDGTVDEDCNTYYRDADEDGFGDSGDSQLGGPTPPPGYVASDADCDDTNDEIYPGATEQCNGVDDDCDNATDEGCVTYYQDADGDGYGNPDVTETVASPAPPPGYVSNGGDCDDTNPSIYFGATEVIDGIDNDCDGQVDEGICTSECTVCDLNDDGVCDEEDLILFSLNHGWDDWDCDLHGDIECICDVVPSRTCDGLDGICFYDAYKRSECRTITYIERLRRKSSEPGDALRIIGKGFGNGSGGGEYSVVHIGPKEFEFGNPKIKLWTDTKIKVKIPNKKYTKNSCAWFNGEDYRKVKVWVTVGGQDSNKLKLKLLKPDMCP